MPGIYLGPHRAADLPLPSPCLSLRQSTRPRFRQDPLPLGDCAPPPALYRPEQRLPAGLERIEQGQLGVVPLGPLFETAAAPEALEQLETEG